MSLRAYLYLFETMSDARMLIVSRLVGVGIFCHRRVILENCREKIQRLFRAVILGYVG